MPRRLAVGLDPQRLALLLAVLHRHGGVDTGGFDVFVNAVGGVRILEPAADLAVLLCGLFFVDETSHYRIKRLIFGEVGLAGEIRPVQRGQERIREAAKLGFATFVIPNLNKPKQAPEENKMIAGRSRRRSAGDCCASSSSGGGAALGELRRRRCVDADRRARPVAVLVRHCAIRRFERARRRRGVEQRAVVPGPSRMRPQALPLVRVARERHRLAHVAVDVASRSTPAVRRRSEGSPRPAPRTSRRAA